MKKNLLPVSFVFIIIVFTIIACISNSEVKYPYKSRLENIVDNYKKNKVDITTTYFLLKQEYEENNSNLEYREKIKIKIDEIINDMKTETEKLYNKKEYNKALVLLNNLKKIDNNYNEIKIENIYREYIKSLQEKNENIFVINDIKFRFISTGRANLEEVRDFLKDYYNMKSYSLYSYYFNEVISKYPELSKKYPEIELYYKELKNYENLDFENLMESIVTVYLDKGIKFKEGLGFQDKAIGTGFVIDSRGYILTNHHVIKEHVDPTYEGYSKVTVSLRDNPDVEITAKVIGYDEVFDVALLKVEKELKNNLRIGQSGVIRVGQKIYTIGNPIGIKWTVTSGIISNKEINFFQMGRAFQVDAAINPGNSGGPLLDERGEVIGIVFAGIPQFQGISFAIPFEWIRLTLPKLFQSGEVKRTWMQAALCYDKNKLIFYYVKRGGISEKAGLMVKDQLLSINGIEVKTIEDAQKIIAFQENNSIIDLEVLRDGERKIIQVKLEERPKKPLVNLIESDSQDKILNLLLGIDSDVVSRMMGGKKYKINKIYKTPFGLNLEISEGESILVYGIKYVKKDGIVLITLRYIDKEISPLEKIFTIGLSEDINTIL